VPVPRDEVEFAVITANHEKSPIAFADSSLGSVKPVRLGQALVKATFREKSAYVLHRCNSRRCCAERSPRLSRTRPIRHHRTIRRTRRRTELISKIDILAHSGFKSMQSLCWATITVVSIQPRTSHDLHPTGAAPSAILVTIRNTILKSLNWSQRRPLQPGWPVIPLRAAFPCASILARRS
jgi:hypothetical protein